MLEEYARALGSLGRYAAAAALQICESADSTAVLRALLTDPDDKVRAEALSSIRFAEHPSLIDSLEPLVTEGIPGVTSAVAYYLNNASSHSVTPETLMVLASDEDTRVREMALTRLVEKAGERDKDWVEQLLENETDMNVRIAAIERLHSLKYSWIMSMAMKGYLSNRTKPLGAVWARLVVARASASTPANLEDYLKVLN